MKKYHFLLFIPILLLACVKNKPEADFFASHNVTETGVEVTFDASSSENASTYIWKINNNAVVAPDNSIMTYIFHTAGIYTITLDVYNDDYFSNSITKEIEVRLSDTPTITEPYYFHALKNGNAWYNIQTSAAAYNSTIGAIQGELSPFVDVTIDFVGPITESRIMDLKGKSIDYNQNSTERVIIKTKATNRYISTEYASNYDESEFIISNITNDTLDYTFYPCYRIEGTFKCKLDNQSKSELMELTQGKYVMILVNTNP